MRLTALSRVLVATTLLAGCRRGEPASAAAASSADAAVTTTVTSDGALAQPGSDTLNDRADRARLLGDSAAPIWMVMASDFQCPFCKTWHDSTMGPIVQNYVKTGKVRLAFINFPLGQHQNAKPAAEAAMCAGLQGKFWQMHDSLFARQDRWAAIPNALLLFDSLATRNGLAMPAWRKCVSSHAMAALIQADRDRAASAGVGTTPTFFIGTRKVEGAQPYPMFRAVIESELAKVRGAKPKPAR